jgi:hypothetical protein
MWLASSGIPSPRQEGGPTGLELPRILLKFGSQAFQIAAEWKKIEWTSV